MQKTKYLLHNTKSNSIPNTSYRIQKAQTESKTTPKKQK